MISKLVYRFGKYLPKGIKSRLYPTYELAFSLERYIISIVHSAKSDKVIDTDYGFKMCIDTSDIVQRRYMTGEDQEEINASRYFCERIKDIEGDLVDVGANVGFYSLIFLQNNDNNAFAFEPLQYNTEKIRENMSLNNFERFTIFPKALSDQHFQSDIWYHPADKGGGGQIPYWKGAKFLLKSENVVFTELDNIEGISTNVSVIKIDVEGHELEVIKGAKATIQSQKPDLFIEIHPERLDHKGESVESLLSTLSELGYNKIYLIQDQIQIEQNETENASQLVKNNHSIWCEYGTV